MSKLFYKALAFILIVLSCTSCEEKNMYEGEWVEELNDITKAYIYPYRN